MRSKLQVRAVDAVDGEHRDVEVRVVVDDPGVDLVVPDQHLGVVHPGDDVGVGHQPVVGDEEAGALDAPAARVVAVDLEDAGLGVDHVGVA